MKRGRVQCKDIPDLLVLRYAAEWQAGADRRQEERALGLRPYLEMTPHDPPGAWDRLINDGYPAAVVRAKLYRMADRELLEYGCSVRYPWPRVKGWKLLNAAEEGA